METINRRWLAPRRPAQTPARPNSKQACEPCRRRKKKCDGRDPCRLCIRHEYDCFYEPQSRKRKLEDISPSPDRQESATRTTHPVGDWNPHAEIKYSEKRNTSPEFQHPPIRYMEANSGVAFPRILGTELNSTDQERLRNHAWNLGVRSEPTYIRSSVRHIISQSELQRLSYIYFEKVHPLYGFIDRSVAQQKIDDILNPEHDTDPYQAVLCGIAAIGSLFSSAVSNDQETALVECAKYMLEGTSTVKRPSRDDVAAWLLRTLYLRMAVGPHAAWIASCTTIHLVEATGCHQDVENMPVVYLNTPNARNDERNIVRQKAKLYWTARLLNDWISHEYGRSCVTLRWVSASLPPTEPNEVSPSLLSLYQISERFADPSNPKSPAELFEIVRDLNDFPASHDVLLLHRANVAFCIYRRLHIAATKIPRHIISIIIALGKVGIKAALDLAVARQPWWHVANVPFQFVCVLLAMNTKDSLGEVSEALGHLATVASHFETLKMQKALKTANSLATLCRNRKMAEADLLSGTQQGPLTTNRDSGLGATPVSYTTNEQQHTSQFSSTATLYDGIPLDFSFDPDSFNWEDFLRADY